MVCASPSWDFWSLPAFICPAVPVKVEAKIHYVSSIKTGASVPAEKPPPPVILAHLAEAKGSIFLSSLGALLSPSREAFFPGCYRHQTEISPRHTLSPHQTGILLCQAYASLTRFRAPLKQELPLPTNGSSPSPSPLEQRLRVSSTRLELPQG